MNPFRVIAFLLLVSGCLWAEEKNAANQNTNDLEQLIVTFKNGDHLLRGYWFEPKGQGTFPVMIFNHGHHKSLFDLPSARFTSLGKFYTSRGYILFVPDRLPLAYAESSKTNAVGGEQTIEKMEKINRDVGAAVVWVKEQPNVDKNYIFMSGLYAGAVQTLLSAEKDWGIRGFVAFSPGVTVWKQDTTFQAMIRRAVKNARAPVFLNYVENDRSRDPLETLQKELQRNGRENKVKTYPPFGKTGDNRNTFAMEGSELWGTDMLNFLKAASKN